MIFWRNIHKYGKMCKLLGNPLFWSQYAGAILAIRSTQKVCILVTKREAFKKCIQRKVLIKKYNFYVYGFDNSLNNNLYSTY